jgi:glycosyltransferase involved in cell wall biosynthesis
MKKKLIIGITSEGSVNLLLGQITFYREMGYDTYLMSPLSERSVAFCENEGCKHLVIQIERELSLLKDLKTLFEIYRLFKKVNPDVINFGTPKISLLGMLAGSILGIPKRIYTCRGFRFEHERGFKRKILIFMEQITSFFAHKIICISPSVEALGEQHNIFSKDKSIVIHRGSSNGVNLELFNPQIRAYCIDKSNLQLEYELKDKFVFGFIGRMIDRKGINELFEVFCDLYSTNKNLRLLLVGPFEMSQISDKKLVYKIDQHPGIINHGKVRQEEVPSLMLIMDVFVLPAWWEGFGNVLVQAAAMGIPVISTFGTGTIDAVQDGFNGILVPVKDKEKLKEAMIMLLEDEEMRNRLAQNGLAWAKNFDRHIIWKELINIYQSK